MRAWLAVVIAAFSVLTISAAPTRDLERSYL